ncbi:MAG TPA: hypothetical protein VMX14_01375 [Anaerolineae bacterium]|nr:hypothetical protein [Anaerolineae bacterium]
MRPYTQPYSATVSKLGGILALPVRGSDEIVRVAIIRNGATVRALDHPDDVPSIDRVDEDFGREEGEVYCYLPVQQKNLHMAWAGPIWVRKEGWTLVASKRACSGDLGRDSCALFFCASS